VRGDSGRSLAFPSPKTGSPPRAWGQRSRSSGIASSHRFTPTCVGTAPESTRASPRAPVHPHVRGDSSLCVAAAQLVAGSPPRAWGQRCRKGGGGPDMRFTPTCVGTARAAWAWARLARGSPPRAWGQRHGGPRRRAQPRFTPTCVGTARPGRGPSLRITVHPHVRGDSTWAISCRSSATGSPPRAWGQRSTPSSVIASRRFTPTCVGTA